MSLKECLFCKPSREVEGRTPMSGSLFVNNDYVSTAHNVKVPFSYYVDKNVALNVTGTLLIFNIML